VPVVAQIGARALNLSRHLFHIRKIALVQVMGLCGRVSHLSALEHSNELLSVLHPPHTALCNQYGLSLFPTNLDL
jgi:hypothetical protein